VLIPLAEKTDKHARRWPAEKCESKNYSYLPNPGKSNSLRLNAKAPLSAYSSQ